MLLSVLLAMVAGRAHASHIYGADFFYTYVSGTTYTVTLVVYGDCGGTVFPSLPTSTPEVRVFNGTTLTQTVSLTAQAPTAGVEVTPVCPSQLSNTNCVNPAGTVPGVKRFTYSRNVTLGSTSANWKFQFTGTMGGGSSAGRSNSITNIVIGAGSTMMLEATLNNTSVTNSSPTYTTIPTPFFCINKAANYNPGSVDPDADNLSYALVTGLDAANTFVTYNTGYSATAPLAVAPSTFNFSNTTGQLSFTPNLTQRSLVVYRVSEFRNGVLVGTSMREMTYVVLSNCNNNAPGANIANPSGGTASGTNMLTACQENGNVSFNLNPTDMDANVINVAVTGLPTGATLNIANNNTTSPTSNFSWNVSGVVPGVYTFYVTYTDDGCPLSSKQTLAYTIIVNATPTIAYTQTSLAACGKKAIFTVTSGINGPWTVTMLQGATVLKTVPTTTATITDSLAAGTYTLRTTNNVGCMKDTTITILPVDATPTIAYTQVSPATCGRKAVFTVTSGIRAGVGGPWGVSILQGTTVLKTVNTSVATITDSLVPGTYTMSTTNSMGCVKDTTITIADPGLMRISAVVTKPRCNKYTDGTITILAGGSSAPYTFAMGTGAYGSNNSFTNLAPGSYVIHARDGYGCIIDSTIALVDSVKTGASMQLTDVLCFGQSTGSVTVTPNGGFGAPYSYIVNNGTASTNNILSGLVAGTYNIRVQDVSSCYFDTVVSLTQPTVLAMTRSVTNIQCNGGTGSISVSATGGKTPYSYSINNGAFSTASVFNSLAVGGYTVIVKDANGCTVQQAMSITEPAKIMITSYSAGMPNCYGATSGFVTVTGTGGTAPLTYAAYGPTSTGALTGLGAGTYRVRITDANSCQKDTMVEITEPARLAIDLSMKQPTCNALKNGLLQVFATGGTKPYTFALNSNNPTALSYFSSMGQGSYILHVQDSNGCKLDSTVTFVDSLRMTTEFIVQDVSCFARADGAVQVLPDGGIAPYLFSFNKGAFTDTSTFMGNTAKAYAVTIKDSIGCWLDTSVNINQPNPLELTAAVTPNNCYGADTVGKVEVIVEGGTEPYAYTWLNDTSATTNILSGLANGNYYVRVKDARGCNDSLAAEVAYGDCCTPFIPTAFTPNGDGRNDIYRVVFKGDMALERMSIYNRFGQEVYTTNDIYSGWDGTFGGEPADVGTYFFYIKGTCGNKGERKIEEKGDITLIR
jgi:hypothetical protein